MIKVRDGVIRVSNHDTYSGGPEAQASVDDSVEVTRVGEIAFEDADRVMDPLCVLRAEAMERAVPKVPG